MKIPKIYLDTSVINFLFADDAPEKKEVTIEFFEKYVASGIYHVFISQVVVDEINRTTDDQKRQKLLDVISRFNLQLLKFKKNYDEIETLAESYIKDGAVPRIKLEDALHVAIATVMEMDILLSWNYRHLANVNKEAKIYAVNLLHGYTKSLRMVTPLEVIYEQ